MPWSVPQLIPVPGTVPFWAVCLISLVAGAALLFLVFDERSWRVPENRREDLPAGGRTSLRLIHVARTDRGIVIDGIIDHGDLGHVGAPITLLLDDGDGREAMRALQRWVRDDSLLDADLARGAVGRWGVDLELAIHEVVV